MLLCKKNAVKLGKSVYLICVWAFLHVFVFSTHGHQQNYHLSYSLNENKMLSFIFFSFFSFRSMSPNLSNRSSPLTFNIINQISGTDSPDPFANGADIHISNIDYRLSRKELQQILQDIFSRHGKVLDLILSHFLFDLISFL